MNKKIAIIGGGAAGMMAAATLVESGYSGEIHLFEKNKLLGAKVIISGGGRCNVTTGYYRRKDLESKYIRGSEFVREAIGQFGPRKIVQRFEAHGVPLKTEEDMRVFPVSDNGKDIVGVFERLFLSKKSAVQIHFSTGIQDIVHQADGKFLLRTSQDDFFCDEVIIATGGNAYAHTGSSGDAYDRARKLGHTITPLGPSLNSFLSIDKRTHELSGIAFPHAKLQVILSDNTKKETIGPVLLTHFGLTGPATFVIAAYSAFETFDHNRPLEISLISDATKTAHDRDQLLIQASQEFPRKQISTILSSYFPSRVVEQFDEFVFARALTQPIGQCSKELRKKMVDFLSGGWKFLIAGRRPGDEFVTAGGIALDEVDPNTMMSRIVPGLYFCGEVLDVDGVTGGYNLTSSRASGRLAGKSAGGN